jgi:hypothetical protein
MRSAYHNLPEVDGIEQAAGPKYRAGVTRADLGEDSAEFGLDLAGAYPPEAGIRHWKRTLTLHRTGSGHIVLDDSWELDHQPDTLVLRLMTPRRPRISPSGGIRLTALTPVV